MNEGLLYLIEGIGKSYCCGTFRKREEFILTPEDYVQRVAEFGICPQCNNPVLEIHKKKFDGDEICERYKRKKAIRKYNEIQRQILNSIKTHNIKYGTWSKMSFRYAEYRFKNNGTFEQWAVDWNGEKELRESKPFAYSLSFVGSEQQPTKICLKKNIPVEYKTP